MMVPDDLRGNRKPIWVRCTSHLRARIVVVVFVAILPAAAVAVYSALAERSRATVQASATVSAAARLAAASLSGGIEQGRILLGDLARDLGHDRDGSSCNDLVSQLLDRDDRLVAVGLAQLDGSRICGVSRRDNSKSLASERFFQGGVAGHFSVAQVSGDGSGMPTLGVATPVRDSRGQPEGVLYATFTLPWLTDVARGAPFPGEIVVAVADARGKILLFHPSDPSRLGQPLPGSCFREQDVQGTDAAVSCPLADHPVFFAHSSVRVQGWLDPAYVVVGIPQSAVYKLAHRAFRRNIATWAGAALFLLATVWIGTDVVVLRRLRQLLGAVREVTAGNLAARARVSGGCEIAEVAAGFDHMAEVLEERRRQLDLHVRRVERLNRVQRVLTAINGAILRIRDRDELLSEACRIAVELGDYRMAWIGLVDDTGATVRPASWAGDGVDYLEHIVIDLDPARAEGRGPTAIAIREGRAAVSNDIARDAAMGPWRDQALRHGYMASAAFPLRIKGQPVGAFNIYAKTADAFDDQELTLLSQVADDTGLGLEHIAATHEVHRLANYDSLTDLPNRELFMDRLQQVLARASVGGRAAAVMVIEVLDLQRINDAFGYAAGDQALRAVAGALSAELRPGETVARTGGQNFGLLLAPVFGVELVARRVADLMRLFPLSAELGGRQAVLTGQAGVAVYPQDGDSAEVLLRHAQLVLHSPSGEHGYRFYEPEIDRQVHERYTMERELVHAVERGEMALEYQPVVELESRRVVGVEALARWASPTFGMVQPSRFIPLAEVSGAIVPLGEWALRTALGQAAAWRAQGVQGLGIAVNVSALQLREPAFLELVESVAGENPNPFLTLEITESELIGDGEQVAETLARLRQIGVRIAIDDFGTGYSSLSYLNRLPVDAIKIDRSFVEALGQSESAASVIKAILAVARSMDLTVVAEGVETDAQCRAVFDLGCRYVQGNLFSRPCPPSELLALFNGGL